MSTEFLNDAFNGYFEKGVAAKRAGNIPEAKRQLLLAADVLAQIAAKSTGELKKSRQRRVLEILETVEMLDGKKPAYEDVPKGTQTRNEQEEEHDPSLTVWRGVDLPNETLDGSIAGLHDVKQAAREMIIDVIQYEELYKKYGYEGGGGILMCGLPGNGKTAIARAIAGEAKCKFFVVRASDIKSKYQGIAVRNIKNLFATARREERAVIFFDDFDPLAKSRDLSSDDVSAEVLTEILTQMEGFERHSCKLLVLAATNVPWQLDTALYSRFKRIIHVPLPDFDARMFIINREIRGIPREENFDIAEIAYKTDGYSGRDTVSLCAMAKSLPLARDKESVKKGLPANAVLTQADFEEALLSVKPSVREKDRVLMQRYLDEHRNK